MKYKQYILTFKGNSEVVALLEKHVPRTYKGPGALADARKRGKAARALFGVEYEAKSITVPKPTVERVRSI